MRRHVTLLLALMVVTSVAAMAQGRVIGTFPYFQNFGFVTGTTTAFPTTNTDGGEFTVDAGTSATFATSIASHGVHNNGGGALRLQSTVGTGDAGIVWYGDFTGRIAGTLRLDWAKVQNLPNSTRVNELRIATNGGSGSTFADIASVTWPQFDNSTTLQTGALLVNLPTALTNASDVRIRIYSTNVSGTSDHPRVTIDNLTICPAPSAVSLNAVSSNTTTTTTFAFTSSAPADSIVIIRRAGAAPTSTLTNGTRYTVGQGLSATDTIAYTGPTAGGIAEARNLQSGTTYHYAIYSLSSCNATYSPTAATTNVTTLTCGSAPGQITGVFDVARSQTSVTLDYTRSVRTDSVLVIRRLRTAPTFVPTTNIRYAAGQALSATDTVSYFGPPTDLITAAGLQADSLYYFAFYGFQTCNGAYSSVAGLDSARTYCPAANAISNVTDLQLLYTTATTAGLLVTAPSDVRNVIVFSRGLDTNLPVPTNGRLYTVGEIVGDDTVRYVGTSTRPIVTGLTPSAVYRFFALAILPCNYRYSVLGDSVNATTLPSCSPTTPGAVDSIWITRNVRDTLRLTWDRASGVNVRYLVVARVDSTPTVGPSSGTWYLRGDSLGRATVLANVGDTTATITGIARNTALFVRVYAFTTCALNYGSSSPVFPMATIGTDSSQRFALPANLLDTISFAGATLQFAEAPSADGSVLIVRRTGHPGTLGIPMQRNEQPVVDAVSADRWWQLTRNGLGDFDVRLLFDVTGLPGMQDTNDLEIIYRPTTVSSWTDIRTEGWDSADGSTWLYSNVQPFVGEYAIGAYFGNNVLPVKLTSFEGFTRGRENILRWSTASEENNAGYRLSRALAGSEEFVTIADHSTDAGLIGAGTTTDARRYNYVDADRALVTGSRYVYRLEDIAIDGQISEIGRVAVDMRAITGAIAASIAPNPATAGSMTTLRFSVAQEGPLAVTLVDVTGVTVRTILEETATTTGERALAFPISDLAAGTYFCQITTAAGRIVVPVTVAR